MSTTFDDDTNEIPLHAHKLKVHADFEQDDEGERRLRGWVACPERGPTDLERCTACSRCRGVLLEPKVQGPEVLCTFEGHRAAETAPAETARAWVDRPALGVTPDTQVKDLGALMLEYGAEALLVVSPRGEPKGVVYARDVMTAMLAGRADESTAACIHPLEDVITSDTSMVEASARLRRHGAHVLPLADRAGHIVGMLTRADVLRWSLRDHMPSHA
jgi:CBS domain-containing protein